MKNRNILASDAFNIPNQICFLPVALHFISSVLSLNSLAPKMYDVKNVSKRPSANYLPMCIPMGQQKPT